MFDGCSSSLKIIVPRNRLAEYKNENFWSRYKDKIFPNNNNFNEINLHCLVNESKSISLKKEYNRLYKLNVECGKSYKFMTDNDVVLQIYDDDFNEIYVGENILYGYLSKGTYYLDIRCNSDESSEKINLSYSIRWEHDGEKVYFNKEYNLLTHLHKTVEDIYLNKSYFINDSGAGLYKIQLKGLYYDGAPIICEAGAVSIYSGSERLRAQLLNKYPNSNLKAESDYNQNVMYVYLPKNGYFYINVVMPSNQFEILTLNISQIESVNINLISNMTSTFARDLITNNYEEEYATKLIINQISKFSFIIKSNNIFSNDFRFVLLRQIEDLSNTTTDNGFELFEFSLNDVSQKTFEVSLNAGVYYIYYYNNNVDQSIDLTLTRILQNNGDRTYAMQADPLGSGYDPGSEVRLNKGLKNNYTITEGFTRNMYFVLEGFYTYSRLNFDWYSSNENVAIVSEFGTVLAKNVLSDQSVTIYAVYKDDPSLIYYRTFTIMADVLEEKIEINCNILFSFEKTRGSYLLELTDDNSPYPWIQYYDWIVYVPCQKIDITCTMNKWGEINVSAPGYATITGTYKINKRVKIIINLQITE